MKVGSLFSGIGGFDLGFERAGFEVAWQCEIDQACRRTLRRHWPDVRQVDDVKLVGTHQPFDMCPPECEDGCAREPECIGIAELADEPVDVLMGGFPCQDISAARDRWGAEGINGSRSNLWWEFARIIEVTDVPWVVIENTGRLRNGRDGADYRAVVGELDRLGYVGIAGILDAAAFGLPARRPRAFIVARNAGHSGGLQQGERLARSFARHDPGCVIFKGSGRAWAANSGAVRPKLAGGEYRLFTPIECERALGFPDNWTSGESDTIRRHQVGNAVAPPVAEWIARRILEASGG